MEDFRFGGEAGLAVALGCAADHIELCQCVAGVGIGDVLEMMAESLCPQAVADGVGHLRTGAKLVVLT